MFKIGEFLQEHKAQLVVMAIGVAISFSIALAVTGDFNEALAGSRRR